MIGHDRRAVDRPLSTWRPRDDARSLVRRLSGSTLARCVHRTGCMDRPPKRTWAIAALIVAALLFALVILLWERVPVVS